jgi:hypothetical protein
MNLITLLALEVIVCAIIIIVREHRDRSTTIALGIALGCMTALAMHCEWQVFRFLPKDSERYLCYLLMITGGICALVGGLRTKGRVLGALLIAAAGTLALCGFGFVRRFGL